MRTISAGLQAHLDGRAATLCRCWRLKRRDGAVLGFTDHDDALLFEGTRFEAAAGLTGSEAEAVLGLGPGGEEVEGALSSEAIREPDLAAGRYDGAEVEVFAVNWQAVEERVLLGVFDLGEVTREGERFRAELRGAAARLDRMRGRIYSRRCDAALGDARCGIDLGRAGRRVAGTVRSAGPGGIVVEASALGTDFEHGAVSILSGGAAGLEGRLVAVTSESAGAWRLSLLEPLDLAAGDRLQLTVGCDKSFATCKARFANAENFRGFPHLPGSDAAFRIAKRDGLHDGSPLVP
ncbi:DUF2163 domain-containing protein [Antarcticirhabdus aurantiaca]|uniref:DUF2163 domain-containing protein n=1 Tax=Antarcticirhabdus aurantiaca TaxID=2606717 RepID=A0ACD4NIM3_9HYPH|nr:DUF2163 domain-containing protein [Antarcticirhabdus aurantiaca]WAJ26694.1 DUF2163 domain-containing protein [Jeongeuplla avenae]